MVDLLAILRNCNCFDEFVGFPTLGNLLGPIHDLTIGVQEIELVGAWDKAQSVISFVRNGLNGRKVQNQTQTCLELGHRYLPWELGFMQLDRDPLSFDICLQQGG